MIACPRIALLRLAPALAAPLALAACLSPGPMADPQVTELAQRLGGEADSFYTALALTPAPQCSYEQNKNFYDTLAATADALRQRLAADKAAPAAARAGNAVVRLVSNARASHVAASARSDDRHGMCLAPGAIALNAQAFARATRAIAGGDK